jgi:CheY-like chemotaxis protein
MSATRIAVVEDNADNRLLLHALLGEQYDIDEYENGLDALVGLSAHPPRLVLLDISLPGMDGNEILARIRADARLRPLPVLALTAHAMTGDREKYLAAGFDDYLTKPIVDETILLGAIARWLPKQGTALD